MRGIVSLAVALALPFIGRNGAPFPERDLLVFMAFVATLVTLLLPGLTLAPLMRLLKIGGDWNVQYEQLFARGEAARAAIAEINSLEREGDVTPDVAAHMRRDYEARLARAMPTGLALAHGDDPWLKVRRAVVRAERRRIIALWREGRIGDEVLHEIERELDYEESKFG
jgi:CPA1 family monovalent cation:H+ antiporter